MKATQLLLEFGQSLWLEIIPELESTTEAALNHDSSTKNRKRRYRRFKEAL